MLLLEMSSLHLLSLIIEKQLVKLVRSEIVLLLSFCLGWQRTLNDQTAPLQPQP